MKLLKGLWKLGKFLILLPYTFPRSVWRGIRRHVKEASAPIDLVKYYQRGSRITKTLSDNAATAISVSIFLIILAKMFAVAMGDTQTVLSLTQHFSTAQVGAALVLGFAPFLAQWVYRMFDSVIQSHRHPREIVGWFWIGYTFWLLISASFLPAWVFMLSVGYVLFLMALHGLPSPNEKPSVPASLGQESSNYTEWMKKSFPDSGLNRLAEQMREQHERIERDGPSDAAASEAASKEISSLVEQANERLAKVREVLRPWQALRAALGLGLLTYLVAVIMSPAPWLPLERLKVSSQGDLVGYVLSQDGDWTQVLQNEPRLVVTVKSDEIVERANCRIGSSTRSATFAQWVANKPPAEYPPCPKAAS